MPFSMKLNKPRGLGRVPRRFLADTMSLSPGMRGYGTSDPYRQPRPRKVPVFLCRGQVGKVSWGATGIIVHEKLFCF